MGFSKSKVLLAAVLGIAASKAGATVIFSDGFETYNSGANATLAAGGGFTRDGSGAATIGTTAGLAANGTHYLAVTPGTAGSWVYKTNVFTPSGANSTVTASVNIAISSPATGTASRGTEAAIQLYDSSVDLIADGIVIWDPNNTIVGGGANHLYVFFDYYAGPDDTVGAGFGYDFGAVTSAQLTSVGYFGIGVAHDYSTGEDAFYLDGVEVFDSSLSGARPIGAGYTDFSDADMFYTRENVAGTTPRVEFDDYLVTSTAPLAPVPEPMAAGLMLPAAGFLARRRRA